MKRKFILPIIIIFTAVSVSSSCKKEDSGDGKAPEIVVLGLNPIYWAVDITYIDLGAIAYDITNEGDTLDLTNNISVEDNVNISEIGDYSVMYNVTDASGLAAEEKVRVVKVVLGK